MSGVRYFKTFVFILFVSALAPIHSAAATVTSEEIIAGWFQSLKAAGAMVAGYDAIRSDPATNSTVIENPRLEWRVGLGEGLPAASVLVTAGQIALEGLRQEANGYRAKSFSASDDYKVEITVQNDSGQLPWVSLRFKGARSDGIFVPHFTAPAEDPQHPVSRYLHYYDQFLEIAVDKSVVGSLLIDLPGNDETSLQAEYRGISLLGLKNGRLEELEVKNYRDISYSPVTWITENPAARPELQKIETTYGKVVQRGIDIRVLVEGLTDIQDDPDPVYKAYSEEASVSDIRVVAGPANLSIGTYTVLGAKVRPGKLSLLKEFDRIARDKDLDNKKFNVLLVDFFSRLAMDEWTVVDSQASGPLNIKGSLDLVRLTDLSSDGMGQFLIQGLDGLGPEGQKLSFDHISIANVGFPTQEAIVNAILNGVPKGPIATAALGPRFGEIEFSNLYFDDKRKPAFSLSLFKVLQSAFVGPIPTDIRIETRDLSLPVEYIGDGETRSILQALGYQVLEIAADLVLNWDEASQDLTLENANVSIENGGEVSLKAGLAGLPKSVIQNPAMFEQALATLQFKNLNLSVRDANLVPGFIEHFASKQNMSPEQLRAALLQKLGSQVGPLAGSPFFQDAVKALGAFMQDPKRLAIDLTPPAPVPFTQILGAAMTAPAQTPDLLGAMISAN